MVFIPDKNYISIGCGVQLTRDVKVYNGTFTKGHRFRVVSCDQRDGWTLKDETGLVLCEKLGSTAFERFI